MFLSPSARVHIMATTKYKLLKPICSSLSLKRWSLLRVRRSYATMRVPKKGNNILLMGYPGAGKTTISRILSGELEMKVLDVDDDVLEKKWGMPVSEKLSAVGGAEFLALESQTFQGVKAEHSIISLTGSQPMDNDCMEWAKRLGVVVYLDVDKKDILSRLEKMKIDRIIGQERGIDMPTILNYREQFYEQHYDVRVICETNDTPENIARKIISGVNKYYKQKGFVSTRTKGCPSTFLEVTLQGLAPDRGLYVSDSEFPKMSIGQWKRLLGLPYHEVALRILEQWIPPKEIPPLELKTMLQKTYSTENFAHPDVAPIVPLMGNQYLLELFHGPTASFKDLPLQLTARFFDYAAQREYAGSRYLVLVATSGDTGGAVLDAFSRHAECADCVVLFPEDGVSSIQKAQMTSPCSDKAFVLGVEHDFDYCQTAIKDIFTDEAYCRKLQAEFGYALSAANSINMARLLPQLVYHVWSYLTMVRDGHLQMGEPMDLIIPTGNFGNILGAYYAKRMGLPIRKMTVASNSNNVLNEFFTTGVYDINHRKLLHTSSPAIDILKSSNLERYLYTASGNDAQLMNSLFKSLDETGVFSIDKSSELFQHVHQDFSSGWCTDQDSLQTLKKVFKKTGYMLDPHTSVAKTVLDTLERDDAPIVISATAHYSKFADSVLTATGHPTKSNKPTDLINQAIGLTRRPAKHQHLIDDVSRGRYHKVICDGDQTSIRKALESYLTQSYSRRRSTNAKQHQ